MDYVNVCQLCIFCKKGSHLFKVKLNCFDDKTGEVIIDPIKRIHYNFQCRFCLYTSVLDFQVYCPVACILQLKDEAKKKKEKMQQHLEQLTSMAFEQ